MKFGGSHPVDRMAVLVAVCPFVATVRPLGDGYWQVRAYVGTDPSGKPMRPSKTITAPNKRAAVDRAREWEKELRASGRTDFGPHTVSEAVDAWIQATRDKKRDARTIASYIRLGEDIKTGLGKRLVDRLTVKEVEAWYRTLGAGRKRGGTRVSHHHAALRAVLKTAIKEGWVSHNVAQLANRPTEIASRGKPPTPRQVGSLLAAAVARSEVTVRVVMVAIATGMRRGELAAMRGSRFDVADRVYSVAKAISLDEDDQPYEKDPKTHQARYVPLVEAAVLAILDQAEWLEKRAAIVGVSLCDDPYLWSKAPDCSVPPHPDWFSREFRAVREAAGVTCRLHDLRHAYATWALDHDLPLGSVSENLGHANSATTKAIYLHGTSAGRRRVADHVGEALRGGAHIPVGELGAGDDAG